jgi:hypothetical protein
MRYGNLRIEFSAVRDALCLLLIALGARPSHTERFMLVVVTVGADPMSTKTTLRAFISHFSAMRVRFGIHSPLV